ncbi:MAG TPA: bifunctional phosphopantothenoylcysteine decarboxylase/phosphopantothenate--cysteine ligase CoaBC [Mycobacteriales bacterium]|nr:bifunctional phosphopantothenoylcysteine decarboxylase/phosphopantothenate--cysteine ligase CoaBC [Mycobacteriales bacterium]
MPHGAAGPGPQVVLGVTGGIAAYKSVELLRLLTESGARVRVIPTASALRFVGAATFAALSGQPVTTSVWDDVEQIPHVRLGQRADLVVVAPATADLLARAAAGRADDLLTATLLTARCPVLLVPAMHTEMWEHAATQANVTTLRSRGVLVVDPAEGRLAGTDTGKGRLPEPEGIADLVEAVLWRVRSAPGAAALDLAGRRVVVSAGGTREHLDPVRFLGNRSSGRQGYAVARAAVARGADVTVVAANVALPDPAGAKVVRVTSADELRATMLSLVASADAVVMAAAVADFRPAAGISIEKIKKSAAAPTPVELAENPDVLAELARDRPAGQVVVGFAAETAADPLVEAREKLARKGCDLLVVNRVGDGLGFEVGDNEVVILGADGTQVDVARAPKTVVAHAVLDAVVARLR